MSSPETYDLVVLGSGPAGEKGAAQAAYFGKKVAVVERMPEPGGVSEVDARPDEPGARVDERA